MTEQSWMSMTLDILGTTFEIGTNDERWHRLLHELWSPFVRAHSNTSIVVLVTDLGHEWRLDFQGEETLTTWEPWIIALKIRYSFLTRALESADIVGVHAAAMASDRAGVLLAGPADAGKTTLALDLSAQGWIYLSDDLVPLDEATSGMVAFPKPLGLKRPELWDKFGWTVEGLDWPPPPWSEGFLVPARSLIPKDSTPVQARLVAFPSFEPGSRPTVERLTRGEALTALAAHSFPASPRAISVLRRICDSAPAIRLRYPDSESSVSILSEELAKAANSN
jgi:hypothetical protein